MNKKKTFGLDWNKYGLTKVCFFVLKRTINNKTPYASLLMVSWMNLVYCTLRFFFLFIFTYLNLAKCPHKLLVQKSLKIDPISGMRNVYRIISAAFCRWNVKTARLRATNTRFLFKQVNNKITWVKLFQIIQLVVSIKTLWRSLIKIIYHFLKMVVIKKIPCKKFLRILLLSTYGKGIFRSTIFFYC